MSRSLAPLLRTTSLLVVLLLGSSLILAVSESAIPTIAAAPNFSCGDVGEIPNADCTALEALYNSTNGNNWSNNSGWLATNTPCSWYGIICSGGRVTELNLSTNNLAGPLPTELQQLTALTALILDNNGLSGGIPAQVGNMTNLQTLLLAKNPLGGTIPAALGNLANLEYLQIFQSDLTGSLPKELGNLSKLIRLAVGGNFLTGTIPPELGNLGNLERIVLNQNRFDGTLPPELGDLGSIVDLWMSYNQFHGEIPARITQLSTVSNINFGYNRLTSSNATTHNFVATHDPDWEDTQTVPPTDVQVSQQSGSSVLVQWTPIRYTDHGGYYEVSYSTSSGGPYTSVGTTANKSSSSHLAQGLTLTTDHFFVVRSYTPAHDPQKSNLWSLYSTEVALPVQGTQFCANVSEIPQGDCEALEALYIATDGDNWSNRSGWLNTKTTCSWYGVTCSGGRVTELRLQSNGLKGTLPAALGNLSALTWLELQFNDLNGSIPSTLGDLAQLTELSLYQNQLTGSIPAALSNLGSLNALRLGANQLSGSVPATLGNLSNLTILGIDENQLDGTLPKELGDLTNLELFNANKNQFTGEIPSTFDNFPNMWRLWLEDNRFSGSIPTGIGNLTNLKNFSVKNNALNGTIPNGLTNLTKLQKLDLGYNALSTSNSTLIAFLNSEDPDWAQTQTIPPTNVKATVQSGGSILVTWSPIPYTGDGGYYTIHYATSPGGPYTQHGKTTNKSSASYTATGLATGTTYYFVVRSYTPAHGDQQSALTSANSTEAMAQTSSFSCNDVTEIPVTECNALVVFFNSTNGSNWDNNSGWLVMTTPCSWFGITCSSGRVTNIAISSNGLKGALPGELQTLTRLVELHLTHNELSGAIPPELGSLASLVLLRLSHNQLSGPIPVELANLSNLEELVLNQNQLTDKIPSELGNLSKLTRLVVSFNQLTGVIPSSLGNLKNLQRLALGRNQLGGSIPPELGEMSSIEEFWMPENKLRDEIPTTLLQLTKLTSVNLANNRLWTPNSELVTFLNQYDPDWQETQTVSPTNVKATAQSANTIRVTWTPILYTGDGGYYEIRYATESGGPYEVHGVTKDKASNTYDVTGLQANRTYYFVIRTYTPAFGNQANNLWSNVYSNEATAKTLNDSSSSPPTIISTPETAALLDRAYVYSIVANGSTPLTFSLLQKPSGMTVNSNTGLINWTPSQVGSVDVRVRVSNNFGSQEQSFTITVNALPEIISAPVTSVAPGQPYAYDVDAEGIPAPTYQLVNAPNGMTINATSGLINWTPASIGIVDVTVRANNSVGADTQEFTINVAQITNPEAPVITSAPIESAVVNIPYSYNVEATGKPSPQFSLSAAPSGMTINATTGLIAWTPNSTGSFGVTVVASNSEGNTNQTFTLTVTDAPTGDKYEDNDICDRARAIPTTGAAQTHNFHDSDDIDWVKFMAEAGKTYVIEIDNIGDRADTVVLLYDACATSSVSDGNNAFGNSVVLEWDAIRNGDYFIKLQHNDAAFAGPDTEYNISVIEDNVPPSAPKSPRCSALNDTELAIQWKKNPERDINGYRIAYSGVVSGNEDVDGNTTTYYELKGLSPNQQTNFRVRAIDFSGNESAPSGEVNCQAGVVPKGSQPTFTLNQPGDTTTHTTSATALTFRGVAEDADGNLSRVTVRNNTTGVEGQDFSLNGASAPFRIEDVGLAIGSNNIQVTAYDDLGNATERNLTVQRLGDSPGAVLIVAGQNETRSLQSNIYNAANRAYRIFKSAGYSDDDIYYIAPVEQKPDGLTNQVDAFASPAAVQTAITTWARDRVGVGQPFTVYLMDHGFADRYCVDGCNPGGNVTPTDLNTWLNELETATGVDQVNIIIEACESGSFLDRFNGTAQDIQNSLSRQNRVVITSTGRVNNAYASAEGAYFSDAFFSCLADSGDLKTCFEQGKAAVSVTGVDQTPWLDDNGDGLYTNADGTVAQSRFVTKFFNSIRPQLLEVQVERSGNNGTLNAVVTEGAEAIDVVWAAVYPPNFQEPDTTTLNLQAPTVRLEADPNNPGRYQFNYINGFPESGEYRIVFYAQDTDGIHAVPRTPGGAPPPGGNQIYLPLVAR